MAENAPPDWDSQFAETANERADRFRRIKAARRAKGCCWQCAKPLTDGQCINQTCMAKQ